MTTLPHFSINFSPLSTFHDDKSRKPSYCLSLPSSKIAPFSPNRSKLRAFGKRWSFFEVGIGKDGILVRDGGWGSKRRVVLVRFNQGFGFNNGGGGGRDNSGTARILGNIALAVGLTYLSMTGQLGRVLDAIGWIFDAIISIWLLAVFIPIVGLGAFLWWAGRDILQGTCPNCGNDFQIFKSSVNDELQLCPFCSQPFSVVGDKFVRDSVQFSNQSTAFRQPFKDFTPGSKKGKDSRSAVVDVEAEVKDAD